MHLLLAGIAGALGVKWKSQSGPRLSPAEQGAGVGAFIGNFQGQIGMEQSRDEARKLLGIDEETMELLTGKSEE